MNQNNRKFAERLIASRPIRWISSGVTPWVLVFAFMFFCLFGPFFIPFIRGFWYEPVTGTVTRANAEPCGDGDGFTLAIQFSYSVAGRAYSGGCYRNDWMNICEPMRDLQPILDLYSIGTKIDAWYDPGNPNISVISRGLNVMQKGILVTAGGFAFIFWFAYRAESQKRRGRSQ